MTVVKDEMAGVEDVAGGIEVAEAEDRDDLELLSDSKLPDDWSIIGSGGLDTEGSDGESVEVIPCEEEKSEDSGSVDVSSPNKLAIETCEKFVQTDDKYFLFNLTMRVALIISFVADAVLVCCLIFHFSGYLTNDQFSVETEDMPDNLRPAFLDVIEEWKEFSSRKSDEKLILFNYLSRNFPLDIFDKEVEALLEKDIMEDPNIPAYIKKGRLYTPNPPPPVAIRTARQIPTPRSHLNMDLFKFAEVKKSRENKFSEKYPVKAKDDCSQCKNDCKKICKPRKYLKKIYDKYVEPLVQMFGNL